jgi:hypothetical protein
MATEATCLKVTRAAAGRWPARKPRGDGTVSSLQCADCLTQGLDDAAPLGLEQGSQGGSVADDNHAPPERIQGFEVLRKIFYAVMDTDPMTAQLV